MLLIEVQLKAIYAQQHKSALSAPRLTVWMEENLSEGFTVFDFHLEYHKSIRTINSLEKINKEI
jgi:transposase-like protein